MWAADKFAYNPQPANICNINIDPAFGNEDDHVVDVANKYGVYVISNTRVGKT